jgi:hypothetical protein
MDALSKTASENAQPRRNEGYILSTSTCFPRYVWFRTKTASLFP